MKKSIVLLALAGIFIFQGCAHTDLDKKVDTQVAQEKTINTRADLRAEATKLIQSAPGLSIDQRKQLAALSASIRSRDEEMRKESMKLRSVLIKNLVTKDYNAEETSILKKRIRKIEEDRLSLTFNAVEQADQILGHKDKVEHREIIDSFFEGTSSRE